MDMSKPVVKLPKGRSSGSPDGNGEAPKDLQRAPSARSKNDIFGKKLYIINLTSAVSEADLEKLLAKSGVVEISLDPSESAERNGHITFTSSQKADRAYALFNGVVLEPHKFTLKLRIKDPKKGEDPLPSGTILSVSELPSIVDNTHLHELFRPFGPLYMCRTLLEGGKFRGNALVQFFDDQHARSAQEEMHCIDINDKTISVVPLDAAQKKALEKDAKEKSQSLNAAAPEFQYHLSGATTVDVPMAGTVDMTNLYIKNLDPQVKSSDLFNNFRRFGRIISARVMNNAMTGQSKGFGFVSFSQPEEAALALQQMNGQYILSKPIMIAYHEPKKPRENRASVIMASLEASPVAPMSPGYSSQASTPMTPQDMISDVLANLDNLPQEVGHAGQGLGAEGYNYGPSTFEHAPNRPTLRRKGSAESISSTMTATSAMMQRQKLQDAVLKLGEAEAVDDIVDLLLTLKKKDRSLCLFNVDFLREKVQLAKEALQAFADDDVEILSVTSPKSTNSSPKDIKPSSPKAHRISQDLSGTFTLPPQTSKAIPIVAPKIADTQPKDESKNISSGGDKITNGTKESRNKEIEEFLSSIEDKPIHEQKQQLGDRLFPLVKATGVKQSPKITIRLLDTVDLRELAYIMHEPEKLKVHVDEASTAFNKA
ncbi:hypothetical protein BZG36_00932 [Bifiguratus adelaidae]|uniref:Uncharacterized protein n=1 Tax=Bifiguratus adelaidae TaxID=1938954 RepID=A0A261Y5G8_9FUNG|nr:hypothetical protein BZG36_00932 [Bifiguratus adelaidae]